MNSRPLYVIQTFRENGLARRCWNYLPLEPSVAQPPLPLQEFWPLQPLSPVLQPPLPLQEFWPLQACLSSSKAHFTSLLLLVPFTTEALRVAVVPAIRPATAAPSIK